MMTEDEKKHSLLMAERNSRADDLRHYRGMSLGVLAGAGTIFFGLMYIYAGLFQVDRIKLSGGARIMWEQLVFALPILGIFVQLFINQYIVTISKRVRNTVYRLEQIHFLIGVDPHIRYPWHDDIGERRKLLRDNNHFHKRQFMSLAPTYGVVVLWAYLEIGALITL